MERHLDLLRQILLVCERHPHGYAPREVDVAGYSQEQVGYHIHLLGQAGLMRVSEVSGFGSPSPCARAIAITNSGHDFLDAIREPTRWERIQAAVSRLSGWTIDLVRELALQILKEQAARALTSN